MLKLPRLSLFLSSIMLCMTTLLSCSNITGVYSADMTLMQSGYCTQFIINSDGTATIIDSNGSVEQTYWERNSDYSIRVETQKGIGYGYYIDFGREKIYYGATDWRSNSNGYRYSKR